ncbi:hypothetical protein TSAR_016207 [Trichomalopsis sarcophagae]|uniref:Uncharacterized protein n=1 Tax=Trichomalopsis sarcophagae TaxID=543379 RepID=A0A232F0Y6_9HYME|nr:hypothetical protein TSAR_016207 [Trichomalopsis sarcophagae]
MNFVVSFLKIPPCTDAGHKSRRSRVKFNLNLIDDVEISVFTLFLIKQHKVQTKKRPPETRIQALSV